MSAEIAYLKINWISNFRSIFIHQIYINILVNIVSCETEVRYQYSKMFHSEPEWR